MSRIVWTNEEKQALLACMIDLCYVTPTMSSKGLMKHAQEEVIPYERRQKITDQKVFTYKRMINEARTKADEHRKRSTQKSVKPQALQPAQTPEPPPAAEPAKRLDTLGQVFELFIDAVADRIMDRMIKAKEAHEVAEKASRRLDELFGGDPMEQLDKVFDSLYPEFKKAPIQPRKPTALVVGLLGVQMECIKQSRPEVDFKFLSAEEAVSHSVSVRDHTFLMTRFINHSVQNKYRKHPNLHFVNGGVTELKTLLHGIFNKEQVV